MTCRAAGAAGGKSSDGKTVMTTHFCWRIHLRFVVFTFTILQLCSSYVTDFLFLPHDAYAARTHSAVYVTARVSVRHKSESIFILRLSARLSAPWRRSRTDGRPGVYSGATPSSAAHGRRSGASDLLRPDPPQDCRPQVPVMPPP